MHIERKVTVVVLALLAISASIAFGQTSSARKAEGGQIAGGGAFDAMKHTPIQDCLHDLIAWKQMLAHTDLGGSITKWDTFSQEIKDARMEVTRACNLYHRAILTSAQQETYDRTILDPKGHPLPPKWERMRLQGTLVTALLKSTPAQQKKAQEVLDTFRERNHKIWATPEGINGGYAKNHQLLEKEFRAILNADQRKEFDQLWTAYSREVDTVVRSAAIKP